jgi:hypothetical protein
MDPSTPLATRPAPIALLPFRRRAIAHTIRPLAGGTVEHLRDHRGSLSYGWYCSAQTPVKDSRSTDRKHLPRAISSSSFLTTPSGIGCRGVPKAGFHTGAHAHGVCHHCCRRLPRDHARTRAQGATMFTACDHPLPLSLQYANGGGVTRDFPVSAIPDRLDARNQ